MKYWINQGVIKIIYSDNIDSIDYNNINFYYQIIEMQKEHAILLGFNNITEWLIELQISQNKKGNIENEVINIYIYKFF